ncbi:MAG: winged helix-turn-helix domain-containing protein [Muricauda sp.]|jgi:molybdate transport system regulatory protein|uniref:Winged helix-turn-helix domain-containing protein n=1 Tax=Flagellimonas sp. MMG031 TaxID=3158549 RepID=A0AAU7MVD2_9FLAO|nr:winged helix-turn-helix domain-containing protein [Allomuricauda sp.]MBO6534335.1 winged helix-turn-helix domain-containing protein [Allomuricauda sp.]MBO6589166.1 winged helix-turn-helix domain-containing protein [Allomuricauda sp.]MBO6618791.1 winged helix-turn-helix domain-containing protein [Allomuricauda sp.]MBO6644704.1 winged helix-turn-helix domain-containing protein [Allomuricauda sp.]MBO6746604.1 winged helix-turn-helix domain-containing protein [Allomuricauda sp.]
METKKELRNRCWIDIDGKKFFGPGRAQLLVMIDKNGSLSKAAKEMGMSYRKAWSMVEDMNQRGQQPYVELHKGGTQGGGAELTPRGKTVLAAFQHMNAQIQATLEQHTQDMLGLI